MNEPSNNPYKPGTNWLGWLSVAIILSAGGYGLWRLMLLFCRCVAPVLLMVAVVQAEPLKGGPLMVQMSAATTHISPFPVMKSTMDVLTVLKDSIAKADKRSSHTLRWFNPNSDAMNAHIEGSTMAGIWKELNVVPSPSKQWSQVEVPSLGPVGFYRVGFSEP